MEDEMVVRTLSQPDYSQVLLTGITSLWTQRFLCDFTVSAEGVSFKVHKLLLASVSEYFRAVFRSGMLEVLNDNLDLKGVSAIGLRAVVSFVYTGTVQLDSDNVLDVLHTAVHLQIHPLMELCSKFLIMEINMDNVKDMNQIADLYNLKTLSDGTHEYILENFPKFAKTDYFKQLPLSEVCKLLKDNRLKCQSEFKLFKQVLEWVNYDKSSREIIVPNFLQHIRLPFFNKEELNELLDIPFVTKDGTCNSLIEKALHFKEHFRQQPLLKGPWTEIRSEQYIVTFGCSTNAMHSCILYKGDWYPLDRALGQPRPFVNSAMVVVNNFLFVCGGSHLQSQPTSSCFSFNAVTGKWSSLSQMAKPRRSFGLVAGNKCLYAIGGVSVHDEVTNTVEVYDIEKNTWRNIASLDTEVSDVAACCHDNKVYVAGGTDQNFINHKEFRMYDPFVDTWKKLASMPAIKFSPKMFSKDGSLYLVDLERSDGACAKLEVYNIGKNQWTNIPLTGVQFSRQFGAAMIGDWIYFIGRNDVDDGRSKKYNVQTGSCEEVKAYPWAIEGPLTAVLRLPYKLLLKKMLVGDNEFAH